ncbi:hypothetical protein E4634_01700 [Mangrovimicrobium sediminis]|uniref:Tetratricopeptide repeat protein n=1 Tax=Mangrovimicrobium sediminis TaxID=2562682 RepID=A0A4Z0M7Z4_9GAMM|nr:hypothetical protein [Haliea sp. SAOS-164]TGD75629.1 hypothetical protein E4634_01700 [Haliea sp. SAOS-164]
MTGAVCRRVLAALCLSWAPLAVAQPAEDAAPRIDLRYGVTLYHYYQQQYFDALTELSAAQAMDLLPVNAGAAELLRGGISLSYGMDREARRIFETLLDTTDQNVDRDRVWFYLGKLAWRRGDGLASASALARMQPGYTGIVADEANYLRAVQALQRGDAAGADAALAALTDDCPFRPYYFYNQGVALAGAGELQAAAEAFRQVREIGCDDLEGRALRDRALVAAGFADLAQGEPQQARLDFLDVRLEGPESDRALLGYGWALAGRELYRDALLPWETLAARNLVSASAREGLIAIPYAYEKLGMPATALTHYRDAAQRYAQERAGVVAAIEALREGDLALLFGLENAADHAWLGGDESLPEGEHAVYLTQLISSDSVQLALQELRDLYEMQRRLALSAERLAVLRQVDDEQREAWRETLEGGRAEQLAQQRERLAAAAGQLRNQLQQAEAANDGRVLADAEQVDRWQRLERAERRARAIGDADAQARLRLLRGQLQWRDSEAFPGRLYTLQREMGELQGLVQQSEQALEAVRVAAASHNYATFDTRITDLDARVGAQREVLDGALALAEDQLRGAALAELESQRQFLALGEGRARLAVARLYDRASPDVPR